jgi:DnaJ-class molecular chaperone
MEPFNHKISTGWALNKFHEDLECIKCHKSGKFVKLDNSCTSCHSNFAAGFDHSATGLKLDETHAELECSDCHSEKDFSKLPDCSNCHDDKSFPKDKPGKLFKITKK